MTRNQWINKWREKRIEQRNFWRNQPTTGFSNVLNEALKELYGHIYLPKQEVAINLVCRYKDKLSMEYLKKHTELVEKWKPEAKDRANELMKALLYSKNPFLAMIPKDTQPGIFLPVPIKYTPPT